MSTSADEKHTKAKQGAEVVRPGTGIRVVDYDRIYERR